MKKTVAWWITTGLFAAMFTASGVRMLSGGPAVIADLARLGYPAHLLLVLGVAKLAGVAVLLAPGLPRLKEWAYAGFAINLVSAAAAHVSAGDAPSHIVTIGVITAMLVASWRLRPEGRTFPFAAAGASQGTVGYAAPAAGGPHPIV